MLSALGTGARDRLRDAAICSSGPLLHNLGPSEGQAIQSIKTGPNLGPGLEETFGGRTRPSDAYLARPRAHLLGQGSPDFLLELAPSSDRTVVVWKETLL